MKFWKSLTLDGKIKLAVMTYLILAVWGACIFLAWNRNDVFYFLIPFFGFSVIWTYVWINIIKKETRK